jgi:hypothetical protein
MFRFAFALLAALGAAVAAVTVGTQPVPPGVPGNRKVTVTPITFPAEYVVDEDLTPADLGLKRVDFGYAVLTGIGTGTVNIANVVYDYANDKIRLFDETPAQVAAEAEVKGPTALVVAYGS